MDRTDVVAGAASGMSRPPPLMTGQVLFVDGGVECSRRGARAW
ncbi:MAG: hypothetical protein ACREH9_02145 [Pseudomonadota bacterium]